MAQLSPRRPRPWWADRVEARELLQLAAGDPAAAPEGDRPPAVRGILGGPAQRRRQVLPTPPRRERPPDLEASALGMSLYGARRAVPTVDQLLAPASRAPADVAGTKLRYAPQEARAALVAGIRVRRSATSAGLTYEVQLLRAGATLTLYDAGNADLTVDAPLILQPGDELRVEVLTAGAAGTELVSHFSVAERN